MSDLAESLLYLRDPAISQLHRQFRQSCDFQGRLNLV